MQGIIRIAFAAGVAAILGNAVGADAELAAWNQERVTRYAAELEEATKALEEALVREPTYVQPATQRAYYQAREEVRAMHAAARRLHNSLSNGEAQPATRPIFQRIQLLRRNAEEQGRKALIPDHIMQKTGPVGQAIMKLRPYYEEEEGAAAAPMEEQGESMGADAMDEEPMDDME